MIPNYTLYGEENGEQFPDILHCESIAARSSQLNWVIAPHRHHAFHQFFWLQSGGGVITIEGKAHSLQTPVAISVPPLTAHGFEFEKNTQGWVITIPGLIMSEILAQAPDLQHRLSDPALIKTTPQSASYFEQISHEHRQADLGRRQLLIHLAGMLVIHLARRYSDFEPAQDNLQNKQQDLVRRFIELLERHFRTRHAVQDYADMMNLSAPHLTRCCGFITGKSTSEMIQDRLLLEAKRSLVYTRLPISDLAYALGFNDPAHFSKFFRRQAGFSPSRFRDDADQA